MNIKKLWFYCAIILPFIDVFTTILFTSVYGYNSESNILYRSFLNHFGNLGFIFIFLYAFLILSITYLVLSGFSRATYNPKKMKISEDDYFRLLLFIGLIFLSLLYLYVYILNLTSLLK